MAGVGQMPDAKGRRRMWVGAEMARRTRRAVLRRPKLARQIVMLEGRPYEQYGVEGEADERERPPATIAESARHVW